MTPFILIPIIVVAARLIAAITPEAKNIEPKNMYRNFLQKDTAKKKRPYLKANITKVLNNKIIPEYNAFKIGKTGNPGSRTNAHNTYSKLFLLCESNDVEFINELEAYYNQKYLNHDRNKNQNKRAGSAGCCKDIAGDYYLYVIVK